MFLRLPILRFALVFFCLVASSGAASDAELQALFQAGNEKLNAKDYAGAIENYNTILESQPKADNVWAYRGLAKMNLQDLSGARADFAQALSLNPKHVDVYRWRAALRYGQKDYSGSVADYTQAIAVKNDDAFLHAARAEALIALSDNDQALVDLNRALELDPSMVGALYLRGEIHEVKENVSAALADYSRVIRLEPGHVKALTERGWIKFYRQDWAGAIEDANKVLAITPTAAMAMRLAGYAQFGQGDYAAAAVTLAKAADATNDETAAYALFIRHHALLRGGVPDKRLATSWGSWKDAPWSQAVARFIVGQINEEALEAAAQDAADDSQMQGQMCEMHFYIGLARLQAGDKSTAKLRFQSALAQNMKSFIEHTLAEAELKRLAQ